VSVDDARRVLDAARAQRIFPAAVAEVGDGAGALWQAVVGTPTFDDASPIALDTPFDLASLTKVIATTTVVMRLVESGAVRLDERVSSFFQEWRGADRQSVTVRDLLEHASGLPARLVDAPPAGRREFEHDICTMRLEYEPRTQSIYSDLGFILLGFMASARTGASLAEGFHTEALTFHLPPDQKRRAAPTWPMDEDVRRGRMLEGDVHDNYAAALGGIAGHAGLFGTAPAVGAFARAILRGVEAGDDTLSLFTAKTRVPGSSRALGWDTMLLTSSCGTRMSPAAFGHVGFTGTSLWIDPPRDRYYVLLTNRACRGGSLDQIREVRRQFHDAASSLS